MYLMNLLNNDYIFIAYLAFVMLFSTSLNTISIYNFFVLKRKISADYIKLQIWIINLVFTFMALPYYMLKETKLFEIPLVVCNSFYALSDGIMFVYNNMLILTALDRYFFICTKIRFRGKHIMPLFYFISLLFACTSAIRLYQKDCTVRAVRSVEYDGTLETLLLIIYRDYFINLVISINMSMTFLLYILIIWYVYKNSHESKAYNTVNKIVVSKEAKKFSAEPTRDKSSTETENLNTSSANKSFFKYNVFNRKTVNYKRFKKSKHWLVTVSFIKVNFFNLNFYKKYF